MACQRESDKQLRKLQSHWYKTRKQSKSKQKTSHNRKYSHSTPHFTPTAVLQHQSFELMLPSYKFPWNKEMFHHKELYIGNRKLKMSNLRYKKLFLVAYGIIMAKVKDLVSRFFILINFVFFFTACRIQKLLLTWFLKAFSKFSFVLKKYIFF